MSKLTFILGGARSGKSSHAQRLASESGKTVTFIATAQAHDEDMVARIRRHQRDRPQEWVTREIQKDIAKNLKSDPIKTDIVLFDCVTLLVNNLFMDHVTEDQVDEEHALKAMQQEIDSLLTYIQKTKQDWIVISNEVGLGIVPAYQMGRAYRDILGWANQRLARAADEVLWMVAGIAVPIHQHR
jgi:adenosylcobinamide kinase/adenosylcobinamide-phosphate guanylyltransferase